MTTSASNVSHPMYADSAETSKLICYWAVPLGTLDQPPQTNHKASVLELFKALGFLPESSSLLTFPVELYKAEDSSCVFARMPSLDTPLLYDFRFQCGRLTAIVPHERSSAELDFGPSQAGRVRLEIHLSYGRQVSQLKSWLGQIANKACAAVELPPTHVQPNPDPQLILQLNAPFLKYGAFSQAKLPLSSSAKHKLVEEQLRARYSRAAVSKLRSSGESFSYDSVSTTSLLTDVSTTSSKSCLQICSQQSRIESAKKHTLKHYNLRQLPNVFKLYDELTSTDIDSTLSATSKFTRPGPTVRDRASQTTRCHREAQMLITIAPSAAAQPVSIVSSRKIGQMGYNSYATYHHDPTVYKKTAVKASPVLRPIPDQFQVSSFPHASPHAAPRIRHMYELNMKRVGEVNTSTVQKSFPHSSAARPQVKSSPSKIMETVSPRTAYDLAQFSLLGPLPITKMVRGSRYLNQALGIHGFLTERKPLATVRSHEFSIAPSAQCNAEDTKSRIAMPPTASKVTTTKKKKAERFNMKFHDHTEKHRAVRKTSLFSSASKAPSHEMDTPTFPCLSSQNIVEETIATSATLPDPGVRSGMLIVRRIKSRRDLSSSADEKGVLDTSTGSEAAGREGAREFKQPCLEDAPVPDCHKGPIAFPVESTRSSEAITQVPTESEAGPSALPAGVDPALVRRVKMIKKRQGSSVKATSSQTTKKTSSPPIAPSTSGRYSPLGQPSPLLIEQTPSPSVEQALPLSVHKVPLQLADEKLPRLIGPLEAPSQEVTATSAVLKATSKDPAKAPKAKKVKKKLPLAPALELTSSPTAELSCRPLNEPAVATKIRKKSLKAADGSVRSDLVAPPKGDSCAANATHPVSSNVGRSSPPTVSAEKVKSKKKIVSTTSTTTTTTLKPLPPDPQLCGSSAKGNPKGSEECRQSVEASPNSVTDKKLQKESVKKQLSLKSPSEAKVPVRPSMSSPSGPNSTASVAVPWAKSFPYMAEQLQNFQGHPPKQAPFLPSAQGNSEYVGSSIFQ